MELERGLAASLGRRVRRARWASRRTQLQVADEAGVSQTMISRLELGKGGSVPLATWETVAAVVGLDLIGLLHTSFQMSAFDVQVRAHRLVVDRASLGGWLGTTIVDLHDPAACTTLLDRHDGHEAAVIRVWDVIGHVGAAIEAMRGRIDEEQMRRGTACRVSGAVVIVSNGGNRRRLTESAHAVIAGIDIFSTEWWTALTHIHVPMPARMGSLWTDAACTRLRPRIPYVDGRARHPLAPGPPWWAG